MQLHYVTTGHASSRTRLPRYLLVVIRSEYLQIVLVILVALLCLPNPPSIALIFAIVMDHRQQTTSTCRWFLTQAYILLPATLRNRTAGGYRTTPRRWAGLPAKKLLREVSPNTYGRWGRTVSNIALRDSRATRANPHFVTTKQQVLPHHPLRSFVTLVSRIL